jgi:hypothetical protein
VATDLGTLGGTVETQVAAADATLRPSR